jgi:hypothetical protein
MSFYFNSIGKKKAVSAAVTDSKSVPEPLKKAIVELLALPTNEAIDSASVDISGHGGSFRLEVKEFIPAREKPSFDGYVSVPPGA